MYRVENAMCKILDEKLTYLLFWTVGTWKFVYTIVGAAIMSSPLQLSSQVLAPKRLPIKFHTIRITVA